MERTDPGYAAHARPPLERGHREANVYGRRQETTDLGFGTRLKISVLTPANPDGYAADFVNSARLYSHSNFFNSRIQAPLRLVCAVAVSIFEAILHTVANALSCVLNILTLELAEALKDFGDIFAYDLDTLKFVIGGMLFVVPTFIYPQVINTPHRHVHFG